MLLAGFREAQDLDDARAALAGGRRGPFFGKVRSAPLSPSWKDATIFAPIASFRSPAAGKNAGLLRAILEEVRDLAEAGYREVQFLGQNVNSYQRPGHRGAVSGPSRGRRRHRWNRLDPVHHLPSQGPFPRNRRTMARSKHVCRSSIFPSNPARRPSSNG